MCNQELYCLLEFGKTKKERKKKNWGIEHSTFRNGVIHIRGIKTSDLSIK